MRHQRPPHSSSKRLRRHPAPDAPRPCAWIDQARLQRLVEELAPAALPRHRPEGLAEEPGRAHLQRRPTEELARVHPGLLVVASKTQSPRRVLFGLRPHAWIGPDLLAHRGLPERFPGRLAHPQHQVAVLGLALLVGPQDHSYSSSPAHLERPGLPVVASTRPRLRRALCGLHLRV